MGPGISWSRALLLAVVVGVVGCTGGEPGGGGAAADPKLEAEEDGFLARRDALLARRVELRQKRAELDERRRAIVARGGDTSEIDREAAAMASSESGLVDEERQLAGKLDALLSQRRAVMQQRSGQGDVAGREAAVATREKDLARREARLAEREGELSSREDAMARRWKDSCTLGGTTTIVQAAPAPKGTRYDRGDVEPLLATARSTMERRGILASDLPEGARGLEGEAGRAMAAGDYSTARLAAGQLVKTVQSIKIDKAFIAAKIGRLNARVKGRKLDDGVAQLFRAATASYGDGKLGDANGKLNQIYVAVQ